MGEVPAIAMLVVMTVGAAAEAPPPVGPPVADRVTLRDGTFLLGQVEGLDDRGDLVVLARRSWVRANQPDRYPGWLRLETGTVVEARLQRRRRLEAWRRARGPSAPAGDPILPWIDREVRVLSDSRPPATLLMRVPVPPSEVASVIRRAPEASRLLRLGWLEGIEGVEDTAPEPLRDNLEGRNALRPGDPAWVDGLLPIKAETEAQWRTRRAATEAESESDLRFVKFREFLLPESGAEPDAGRPARGAPVPEGPGAVADRTALLDTTSALTAFRSVNSVSVLDAVRLRLAAAADRGRIGAIVSNVDWPTDFRSVSADTALWVRQENGAWAPVVRRALTVRPDDPPDPLGPGPVKVTFPIRTAVHVLELFAAAPSSTEASRERQDAAALAQRALGRVRADLDAAIGPFVLPVVPPR